MKDNAQEVAQAPWHGLLMAGYRFVPVTQTPVPIPSLGAPFYHDPANFPPQTTTKGGTVFTRYTIVEQVTQDPASGDLVPAPLSSGDTGLKRMTNVVTWPRPRGLSHVVETKIFRRGTELSTIVEGVVRSTDGVPIGGVDITSHESNFQGAPTTDTGNYRFIIYENANIGVNFSHPQFLPTTINDVSVTRGVNRVTRDVTLERVGTGTVQVLAWDARKPVISQVAGQIGANQYEYVQVFIRNYPTWPSNSSRYGLKFQRRVGQDPLPINIDIQYITPNISRERFFLFANTTPVVVNGVSVTADAVWDTSVGRNGGFPYFTRTPPDIIPIYRAGQTTEGAGVVILYDTVTNEVYDTFGWKGVSNSNPGGFEGAAMNAATGNANKGMELNEAYVRIASTMGYSDQFAPAYDSNDNNRDFVTRSGVSLLTPRNSISTVTAISGVPLAGAHAQAGAVMGTIAMGSCGIYPCASATLSGVEEGIGRVVVFSSNPFYGKGGNVTVSAGAAVASNILITNTQTPYCYFTGLVVDELSVPLAGIKVGETYSNSFGSYATIENCKLYVNYAERYSDDGRFGNAGLDLRYNYYVSPVFASNAAYTHSVNLQGMAYLRAKLVLDDMITPAEDWVDLDYGLGYGKFGPDGYSPLFLRLAGSHTMAASESSWRMFEPPEISVDVPPGQAGKIVDMGTFVTNYGYATLSGQLRESGKPISVGVVVAGIPDWCGAPGPTDPLPTFADCSEMASVVGGEDGSYSLSLPPNLYNVYAWRVQRVGESTLVTRKEQMNMTLEKGGAYNANFDW